MWEITPQQLQSALFVISAILAALLTIDKVIEVIKKWRQPAIEVQSKLSADKNRLELHEQQILELTKKINTLSKAQIAHITHELTNEDKEKLKEILTMLTNSTVS